MSAASLDMNHMILQKTMRSDITTQSIQYGYDTEPEIASFLLLPSMSRLVLFSSLLPFPSFSYFLLVSLLHASWPFVSFSWFTYLIPRSFVFRRVIFPKTFLLLFIYPPS